MTMRLLESAAGWAWENSLAASILIALVFAVRLALRRSAPPALMHLLGLLILARLLLPLAPPSPVSVFNLVESPVPTISIPLEPVLTPPTTIMARPSPKSFSPLEWLPLLWATGALLILGRVLQQHWRVRSWVKQGQPVTNQDALRALDEAREQHGLRRAPHLRAVNKIEVPALFGFLRPTILLPPRLVESRELRLIFLHELAHVRRRHILVNWIIVIAQALHWFNPLVWLAMRRLRADQEILCDLDVMRLIGQKESHSYGETLLALASNSTPPLSTILPISTNFKQMKERIRMIIQFKPMTKRLLVIAILLAVMLSAVTFTRAVDKKKTPPVLPVLKEERQVDPALGIKLLEEEFEKQNKATAAKAAEVDQLRSLLGIFGDPPNSESMSSLKVEKIRHYWSEISRLDSRIRDNEMLRASAKEGSNLGMLDANSDPGISRLLEQRENSEREIARLSEDRTSDHPEVKAAERVYKTIQQQLDKRIEARRKAIESALERDKTTRDELEAMLAKTEAEYRNTLEKSRAYFRAKKDLEIYERIRDSVHIRILQEKVDAKLPKR
jgi:beta-lactamase regulating signal transducer with metallopeptidase domain